MEAFVLNIQAMRFVGILFVAMLFYGCTARDKDELSSGPIELSKIIDKGEGAYQASPFTRTVEDVQLFEGEAPCILVTNESVTSPVYHWRTQALLIPKVGPGEVSYDAVTIYAYNGYGYDSGGQYRAEYFWPADVDGDGVQDLLILAWRWGGAGWFYDEGETDPARAPENEPVGVRVIIRKATDRGHPLGIESDLTYRADALKQSGLNSMHFHKAMDTCKDPVWRERLAAVEQMFK